MGILCTNIRRIPFLEIGYALTFKSVPKVLAISEKFKVFDVFVIVNCRRAMRFYYLCFSRLYLYSKTVLSCNTLTSTYVRTIFHNRGSLMANLRDSPFIKIFHSRRRTSMDQHPTYCHEEFFHDDCSGRQHRWATQ
jgi:hypothetical protein